MHTPVLLNEVIYYLNCKKGASYIDCTFGRGGHSKEILSLIGEEGRLIAIDWDKSNIEFGKRNFPYSNIFFFNKNFIELKQCLKRLNIDKVDGVLFDLGFCLEQIEDEKRGFSFLKEGPLDMRYCLDIQEDAFYIVNTYSEQMLYRIIKDFGEERWAKKIARIIISERKMYPITTTSHLVSLIKKAIPRKYWHSKLHIATKTFQALRITVNKELDNLKIGLLEALSILKRGGRIVVISFHSLEDRIVKNTFKQFQEKGFTILTKKPVVPSLKEKKQNPHSRSAKLRAGCWG